MRKGNLAFILVLPLFINAQSLLLSIDSFSKKNETEISFIKTINKNNNLSCYIINVLETSDIDKNSKRLYVFKIFTDHFLLVKKKYPLGSQIDSLNMVYATPYPPKKNNAIIRKTEGGSAITEFYKIKKSIDDVLYKNLFIKAQNLSQSFTGDYQMLFDNLTIQKGDSIYYFDGSVLLQYFNLVNFKQVTPLQSTNTILNTEALITKMEYVWDEDGDGAVLFPSSIRADKDYIKTNRIYLTMINAATNDTSFVFLQAHFPII